MRKLAERISTLEGPCLTAAAHFDHAGLRAFAGGIGFVVSTPAVWGYALVPVAMVTVLLCALGGLAIWGALYLGGAWLEPSSLGGHLGLVLLDIVLGLVGVLLAVLLS